MHWWETDSYTKDEMIPQDFIEREGPYGVALVRTWKDGKTDPGWGEDKFMENYRKGKFDRQIAQIGIMTGRGAGFAYLMRSVSMICIDIDGKNGGLQSVGSLGMLPLTLAETSKSGNGYHLFYTVPDTWDTDKGFAMIRDRLGIVQGVDIRGVGCVYHYPGQLWNGRPAVELPQFLLDKLLHKQAVAAQEVDAIIALLDAGDEQEIAILHHDLEKNLAKPIPPGKRNTTLFAIGSQMKVAGVPAWKALVIARGLDLGLDHDELDKIVRNIVKYGV